MPRAPGHPLNYSSTPSMASPVLSYSPSTTRAQIQMCNELKIVCHGGLHDHFDYYGWIIATDTHILAKHNDLAPGNHVEMDSQRAILAALHTSLFWLRSTLNNALLAATTTLHIHVTNNTIYKTLSYMLQQSSRHPNQMLQPHMELYLTILHDLERLSTNTCLNRVAPLRKKYNLPPRPSWH